MLKLGKKFALLQRGASAQQFKQMIFQFFAGVVCFLFSRLELGQVGNQGARRNTHFQHGGRTAAQKIDQLTHLRPLLWSPGRELHSHAVSGMRHPHHAFGMNFKILGLQAEINQSALGKGRIGLHVAAAQAQVGQLAIRHSFIGTRSGRVTAAFSQAFSSAEELSERSRK